MNWQDFFDTHKDYLVELRFYECARSFTLEELYQAFKSRLGDEPSEPSLGSR